MVVVAVSAPEIIVMPSHFNVTAKEFNGDMPSLTVAGMTPKMREKTEMPASRA